MVTSEQGEGVYLGESTRGVAELKTKWLEIVLTGKSASGLTEIWTVRAKNELATGLGTIRYLSPWRCYVYEPKGNTVYEKDCLRDIADFCDERTRAHRIALRVGRKT